jgi:hypothetical protein
MQFPRERGKRTARLWDSMLTNRRVNRRVSIGISVREVVSSPEPTRRDQERNIAASHHSACGSAPTHNTRLIRAVGSFNVSATLPFLRGTAQAADENS